MSDGFWKDAVNRRSKNLAMMTPFFDLEANKAHVDMNPYDMHLVCSVVMEAIVGEMGGADGGTPYDHVIRDVTPVLRAVNPRVTDSEVDKIASHIIGKLSNERGRGHFEATYQRVLPSGAVERLTHAYRLLEQKLSPEDELVYVATPEAIHIYLSGLGHDLEAEEAANDAVLEHYLQRGKHREAGEAAEVARKRSVQHRTALRAWLVVAERSFDELRYADVVLPELERVRGHVENRSRIEQRQIDDIQVRELTLGTADENRITLAQARRAIEEAATEHVRLLADLQRCSTDLLEHQRAQRFRRGEALLSLDPKVDFMEPLLRETVGSLQEFTNSHWHLLAPPRIPKLPDLAGLLDSMLAEVRTPDDVPELDPLAETIEEVEASKRFTPEVVERASAILGAFSSPFRLSEVLRLSAEKHGADSPESQYLAASVPQWFENLDTDDRRAESANDRFAVAGVAGDELILHVKEGAR
jgi:hypothetical protein